MSLNDEQKAQCTEIFQLIDKKKTGQLTMIQLEYALGVLGKQIRKKDLQKIYGDGEINLEKFFEICEQQVDFNQVENSLIDAFKILDPKNTGYITTKDLAFVLRHYQEEISKKDIDNIIKEANPDPDGKIDYVQFAKDMLAK